MRKFNSISVIVFALVLMLGIISAQSIVSMTNYSISPVTIKPGTVGSISILFTNTGTSVASNVVVFYGLIDGAASLGPKNMGDLAKGTSASIIIPLIIPENYNEGIHSIPLLVQYGGSSSSKFTIPVPVLNPPELQFVTDDGKKTVKPGEEFELSVIVNNLGGEARDIVITTSQDSTFELSGISKYKLSKLDAGASTYMNFTLVSNSDTAIGKYNIPLNVQYVDALGSETNETVNVGPVTIVDLTTIIEVTASTIGSAEVGSIAELNITLFNHGETDEEGVFVSIGSSESLVPIGSPNLFMDTVPANGESSKIIGLGIDPLARPGYYVLPLTVKLSGGQSFETTVGLAIQAASQLSILWETTPNNIAPGSSAELSLDISNTGDSGIRSVIVTLVSDTFTITGDKTNFIGTLDVDDTIGFITTITAPQRLQDGESSVNVIVTFKDSNNQERIIEKKLDLSIGAVSGTQTTSRTDRFTSPNGFSPTGRQGFGSQGGRGFLGRLGTNGGGLNSLIPLFVGLIVLTIALFFGYRWYKKRGTE